MESAGMEASELKAGVGEEENPWFVDSLEHFRYYFCPECAATKSENYRISCSVYSFMVINH